MDWTRFAVPGLLFASGFLFKKSGIGFKQQLTKILLRIIPPYLFCSFVILIFNLPGQATSSEQASLYTVVFNLIFGNVIGIYYFVFVILYLYMFSFFLKILPVFVIWILWICMIAITVLFYFKMHLFFPKNYDDFFFLLLRHPCLHVLPYLSGWLFSMYYQRVRTSFRRHFRPLIVSILFFDIVVLFIAQSSDTIPVKQLAIQAHIYLSISYIIMFGFEGPWLKTTVSFLSKNTYGIFLLHFPIVRYMQSLLLETPIEFSIISLLVTWLAGIIGSLIIIDITRRISGRFSLYIVGA